MSSLRPGIPAGNSCGLDPDASRHLTEKLQTGELVAVLHRPTGRIFYTTPADVGRMQHADYLVLKPGTRGS